MALLALLFLPACQVLQVADAQRDGADVWTTEGGTPERTRSADTDLAPPLEEAWRENAEAGFGPVSPLVVGNTVLVATRQGEVRAFGLEDGRSRGTESFGDNVDATPLVAQGLLLVPVEWGRHALVAVDLVRGQRRWARKGAQVHAAPVWTGAHAVVADEQGVVRALDVQDGEVVWEAAPDSARREAVRAAPLMAADDAVFVVDQQGHARLLDAATGDVRWQRDLGLPVEQAPAAADGLVVVPTTRGRLLALDAATGEERWRLALPDTLVRFSPPAIAGQDLVVAGTDRRVRKLDLPTGEERWVFEGDDAFRAAPLVSKDHVFAGSMGGDLYAVTREDGTLAQRIELDGRVKSALAAHDGRLLVLAEPRYVYAFQPTTPDALAAQDD